jgi:hypothetical protein
MSGHPLWALYLLILVAVPLGILLLVSLLMFPFVYLRNLRCRLVFRSWLKESGFQEISHVERWYWHGPFSQDRNEKASISRLVVRDGAGNLRKGFVRCADHKRKFLGQHKLEFRWDDEPERRASTSRIWFWTLPPFLSAVAFLLSAALWFSSSRLDALASNRSLAPLIVGGIAGLGITVMVLERRRRFPQLRLILGLSREQFGPLLVCQLLSSLGGLLQGAAFLLFRALEADPESPAKDRSALWGMALFVAGNALFFSGLVLRNRRLRAAAR